jgi:uroporphyrinogen-III synthase
VVLTRSHDDNAPLALRLAEAGVRVLEVPTVALRDVAPDPALAGELLNAAAIAFTSRHGVEAALRQLGPRCLREARGQGALLAVVGERTAEALRHACVGVDLVGPKDGAALAQLLARQLEGERRPVWALQARHARPELVDGLRAAGLTAQVAVLYENAVPPRPPQALLDACQTADALYAAAPSACERLLAWAPQLCDRRWLAIGPTTAAALRALQIEPAAVARTPDDDGALAALMHLLPSWR